MRIMHSTISPDLSVDPQAGGKKIPKIDAFGLGYGGNGCPFYLISERIKKYDCPTLFPVAARAEVPDFRVGVAAHDGNSVRQHRILKSKLVQSLDLLPRAFDENVRIEFGANVQRALG